MTPLLQVRDLTKRYGARLGCGDVSFDLYPGEVMGIVGESGSGKSTLVRRVALELLLKESQMEVPDVAADFPNLFTANAGTRRRGASARGLRGSRAARRRTEMG